eukprot:3940870-Rhodomonas_salina.1
MVLALFLQQIPLGYQPPTCDSYCGHPKGVAVGHWRNCKGHCLWEWCCGGLQWGQGASKMEWDEALCHSPQNFSVVFPAKYKEIVVRMNGEHSSSNFPQVLNHIIPQTCTATGNGIGRGVFDLPRYDLSACDVESM